MAVARRRWIPWLTAATLACGASGSDPASDAEGGAETSAADDAPGQPSPGEDDGDPSGGSDGGAATEPADGSTSDAELPGGEGSTGDPADPADPCAGVTCAGLDGLPHGSCFVDATGAAACACDLDPVGLLPTCPQRIPTQDLRCLTRDEMCLDTLGYWCIDEDQQAWCTLDAVSGAGCSEQCFSFCGTCSATCDPSMPFLDNVPTVSCECQGADVFDPETSTCVPHVSACEEPVLRPRPRWDLQVSGAAELRLVEADESDYNWSSGGGALLVQRVATDPLRRPGLHRRRCPARYLRRGPPQPVGQLRRSHLRLERSRRVRQRHRQ